MDRTLGWGDPAEATSRPRHPPPHGARRTQGHAPPPLPGTEILEEVAAPGPEGEQPILTTFRRKPELGDRTGRKQGQTSPPVSVWNSGWPNPEHSAVSKDPGPPFHIDSDSSQLPEEDSVDSSAQDPAAPGMDPSLPDTSLPPRWPEARALLQQLPPQDSDHRRLSGLSSQPSTCPWGCPRHSGDLFLQERYCLALGEEELAELRLFCAQRKQKALGQGVAHLVSPELEGYTCEKCRQQLEPGEVGVFAAPEGEQRCWHWPCFACQACGQVLMHLIYFYHGGRLYCGRHHAELLRPRCPACDQLIFSQRCTEAEGQRWHENHFCCLDCSGPLVGGRYTLPGGSPCCPSCFENRYPDAAGAPEGRAPPGAAGPDRSGEGACAPESAVPRVPRCCPDTPTGRGRPDATRDPEERAPCPTCSSSSDSDPEGFFLGRRLPQPRKIPEDGDASGKRCSVC